MRRLLPILLCVTGAAAGQEMSEFDGRPALLLANDKLALTVLIEGGSLASLVLNDDPAKLNPLWDPARLAREQGAPVRARGGTGHFVCVDGFGPTSREEQAAGLQGHGEAHRQVYQVVESGRSGNVTSVVLRSTLPIVQEVLTRRHQVVDGENVIYVESELESLLAFDRPVVWAEHATIGAPFLAPLVTVVDLSAGPSQTRPYPEERRFVRRLAPGKDFTWPMAPMTDGQMRDVRMAPADPDMMDHTTTLMDPNRSLAFASTINIEKRLIIGWLFRRDEFPWLQIWENYPKGKTLARGLEFSTQPYDVPRREAISLGKMFGAPTYRWLPAKSKIGARFLMFYARTPEGMTKVDDVRLDSGKLIIEDRQAGKRLELAASLGL